MSSSSRIFRLRQRVVLMHAGVVRYDRHQIISYWSGGRRFDSRARLFHFVITSYCFLRLPFPNGHGAIFQKANGTALRFNLHIRLPCAWMLVKRQGSYIICQLRVVLMRWSAPLWRWRINPCTLLSLAISDSCSPGTKVDACAVKDNPSYPPYSRREV